MKISIYSLLALLSFSSFLFISCDDDDSGERTRIILVRHTERPDGVDTLNAVGLARAEELSRVLAKADVEIIFASNRYRTQQTAQPLATSMQTGHPGISDFAVRMRSMPWVFVSWMC